MKFAIVNQGKNITNENKRSMNIKQASISHQTSFPWISQVSNFHEHGPIGSEAVLDLLPREGGFDFAKIGIFQPKLRISQPGDEYEHDANKVAEQIMRRPTTNSIYLTAAKKEKSVDRDCEACGAMQKREKNDKQSNISRKTSIKSSKKETEEITNNVNSVLSIGGSSLDADTREFMESRFGYDFSKVKIHSDETAAQSARSVNALAYTVGNDIVFDKGMYMPGTVEGRGLLAHELTHIIQQAPIVGRLNGILTVEPSSSSFEHEAQQASESVIRGRGATVSHILPSNSVARMQRAEHGTYVSTIGDPTYLDAGEQFYRTWHYPNVKRVSTMADVLDDLDRSKGTIDKFRIVSHGTRLGLELGLLPQVSPLEFGKEQALFTNEKQFREQFIEMHLVTEDFFNHIYNKLQEDKTTSDLLATLGAGKEVPAPDSPLGILVRAIVDARYLADVEMDTGGKAKVANRSQLEVFNNLRITTYSRLVENEAPNYKIKDVKEAIVKLMRHLPTVLSSSGLNFTPLTSEEAKELADPFLEMTGGKVRLRQELRKVIEEGAGGPYLRRLRSVKQKISNKTHIEIRGCNVGRDPELLESFRGHFGQPDMLPSISAPDLYQYFFQLSIQTYGSHPMEEARLGKAFSDPATSVARSFEDLARMKAGEMTRVVEEKNLTELAAKYGLNAEKVRKLNPEIPDPDKLDPGVVVWLVQRTQVTIGTNKKLGEFCREYLDNEYAWPKVLAANPLLKSPYDLKPGDNLNLPMDVLTAPVAAPSPTLEQFTTEIRKGKGVAALSTEMNRPILHADYPLRAAAVGGWLASQKFDPKGRTAVELSKLYLGGARRFEAARRGTYVQFLSRGYPIIEDPIFPEDPRYDKHIICRP